MNSTSRVLLLSLTIIAMSAPSQSRAQTTWTISGQFKASVDYTKIGSTNKRPNSESRVTDEQTVITFRAVERLGDGLFAFARLDWKVFTDAGISDATGTQLIGLQDWNTFGRLMFGRVDVHYFNRESDLIEK